MGTKNNPGPHECWDKALPDEPRFALLARDPQGADLVGLWCCLRRKDFNRARFLLDMMIIRAKQTRAREGDSSKISEAIGCSDAMRNWYMANPRS